MSFLKIVVPFLAATGLALPHDQMVNNESVRDVGVIYSGNNFTGDATFLVTHKKERKCETALSGVSVSSVQICVPATCILYKSNDCTASGDGNDYYFQGPVDADNLQANPNMACDSYECGSVEEMSALIGNTASALVNSEGGHWGVVSH